jgi:glycosyltransferase involved in cell wall biosynthesis
LADVCVFPSISEPFGIVSLEAMSMEKPVVVGASGISGLKEQVIPDGENKTGIHVDGRNPDDIAWGIKEVLRNEEEARRWGKNGRKRVLENFTLDMVAKNTIKIYEEFLKK